MECEVRGVRCGWEWKCGVLKRKCSGRLNEFKSHLQRCTSDPKGSWNQETRHDRPLGHPLAPPQCPSTKQIPQRNQTPLPWDLTSPTALQSCLYHSESPNDSPTPTLQVNSSTTATRNIRLLSMIHMKRARSPRVPGHK